MSDAVIPDKPVWAYLLKDMIMHQEEKVLCIGVEPTPDNPPVREGERYALAAVDDRIAEKLKMEDYMTNLEDPVIIEGSFPFITIQDRESGRVYSVIEDGVGMSAS